jgi:HAD superfamily hydrolase (TIGR01509 family)
VTRAGLPAAVLWDMDGTLVDTEPYWIRAEHELVAEHGGVWTDADAHLLVGNALEVSAGMILERTGLPLSVDEVVRALLSRVIELVGERLPWRPGARALLADLVSEGVPCLLVTMSWRSLADEVVRNLPGGSFRALVTGDEVSHGKPHPEPYLAAARLICVDPRDCVAIEDSPTGVRSATAAGVPTLAVPHVVPVPAIPGSVRLDSLEGLRARDLLRVVSQGSAGDLPIDLPQQG